MKLTRQQFKAAVEKAYNIGYHAALIAESRHIDLATAQELVYLRDLHADERVKRALDSVEQCIRSLLLPDSAVATATGKQMTAEYGLTAIAALRRSLLPVQQDDGWVTFGRIKEDVENETRSFERIPVQPATSTPTEAVCPECGGRAGLDFHDKGCSFDKSGGREETPVVASDCTWKPTLARCIKCSHRGDVRRKEPCPTCGCECEFTATTPSSPTKQARQLVDKEKTMIKCRLCGKGPTEVKAVLHRVNEKGVEGIWECRPICGAEMNDEDAILAAIDGVFDNNPFASRAQKLLEELVAVASHVPCDCEDLWCVHWKDEVTNRIASFAAEAATQGEVVGIERAARLALEVDKDVLYGDDENVRTAVSNAILALSPDPSYVVRVRNEAATAALKKVERHLKGLSDAYARYAEESANDPETKRNEMTWAHKAATAETILREVQVLIAAIGDDKV